MQAFNPGGEPRNERTESTGQRAHHVPYKWFRMMSAGTHPGHILNTGDKGRLHWGQSHQEYEINKYQLIFMSSKVTTNARCYESSAYQNLRKKL